MAQPAPLLLLPHLHAHTPPPSCAPAVPQPPAYTYRSPKHDRPAIDIDYASDCRYWTISIRCRDRTKLLFDTGAAWHPVLPLILSFWCKFTRDQLYRCVEYPATAPPCAACQGSA
jgi:hypothetical protein